MVKTGELEPNTVLLKSNLDR